MTTPNVDSLCYDKPVHAEENYLSIRCQKRFLNKKDSCATFAYWRIYQYPISISLSMKSVLEFEQFYALNRISSFS